MIATLEGDYLPVTRGRVKTGKALVDFFLLPAGGDKRGRRSTVSPLLQTDSFSAPARLQRRLNASFVIAKPALVASVFTPPAIMVENLRTAFFSY